MLRPRHAIVVVGMLACSPTDPDGSDAATSDASTVTEADADATAGDASVGPASGGTDGTGQPSETICDDGLDDDGDQRIDCDDEDCADDPACGDRTVRIATWNILRVDPVGSQAYEALLSIVLRLDADILCVQEVGEGEEASLQALVEAAGYVDGLLTPASGVPGEGIANACMSRFPIADGVYLWSDWISPDPSARDLTRPFVRMRVQVPGTGRFVSVLSGHLKAGTEEVDRFRRMVEAIRLGQAATEEMQQYPDNVVAVVGDFNDVVDPPSGTFTGLPAGLPDFYELGDDITFPIPYTPTQPLLAAGLKRVEARVEDGNALETFIPANIRLDYIYVTDEDVVAAEVYDACADNGIDDGPPGDAVAKAGEPLTCGVNELASDHRPVVVDLRI